MDGRTIENYMSSTNIDDITLNVTSASVTPNLIFWEDEVRFQILIYGVAVIFMVGLFGNILNIVVLCSKAYGSSPSNVILTALSISDLGYVLSGLPRFWIVGLTRSRYVIRFEDFH